MTTGHRLQSGSCSIRSSARTGIPLSSSIFRTFVKAISYCRVNPSRSISATGVKLSRVNRGIPSARISSSISVAGAKTRSQYMSSFLFRML